MLLFFFIVLLLIFITIALIIHFHKYFYRFWIKHPMPWTTLRSAPTGIISTSPPPAVEPLPDQYQMNYHFHDVSIITSFLNKHYIHPNTPFEASYTSTQIENLLSCGKCNVLKYNDEVVGMIFYYKVYLNNQQLCYWIDKLCIDMFHRGKHLSGVIISHTLFYEYQKDPVVAIFHKDKIMPFPEFYSCKTYFSVINPVLHTSFDLNKISHATISDLLSLPKPTDFLYFDIISNQNIWEMHLQDSNTNILLINDTNLVCLQRLPIQLKDHPNIPFFSIMCYTGDQKKIVDGILSYLCQEQKDEFILVFPQELISLYTDGKWQLFDLQNFYFYNYRVNKKSGHKPLYFPFSCF